VLAAKVVTVTPAGRRRYMRVLHRYLLRHRDVIHKHIWWVNTNDPADIVYMSQLKAEYPGFYELQQPDRSDGLSEGWHVLRIPQFYAHTCDPDTVYVRLDDDIVWMAPDAIEKIVACRLGHPEPLVILGNIVNNALCNYLHQTRGAIPPDVGPLHWACECPFSWANPEGASVFHAAFLGHLGANTVDAYRFKDRTLKNYERFSINAMAWMGRDFAEFDGKVGGDEEPWLSVIKPSELGRPNMICGDALFVHFAFYTQRDHLEANSNALDVYTALAEGSPLPELRWQQGERRQD
jgi:hypothetical protein